MADSTESSAGGSWWGSWVQAAKETSANAMEFVKKDLVEFTSTVQRDTNTVVQATGSTLKDTFKPENTEAAKDKMKQSINGFFDGLSKALTIPAEDKDQDRTRTKGLGHGGAIYDRSKARLHAVQVDPGTYLNEPSGSQELFERWLETFSLDSRKGDISELLVVKVEVRALYTKLVPSELSHSEFWQRYFYKLHQLEQDEARKQALMKRAETPTEEDSLGWEDDWSGDECEEFEKVSESEVKAVQREDVQSRLSPILDKKDSVTENIQEMKHISASVEEKSVNKEATSTSKSETQTKHAESNSADLVDTSLQKVEKCDSPESKVEEHEASETKTEIHAKKENTDGHNPVVEAVATEPDIPTSPVQVSSNKITEEEQTPKEAIPLTTKEADLLSSATKSKEELPVSEVKEAEQTLAGSGESAMSKEKVVEKGSNSAEMAAGAEDKDLKTKVKGDLVVVGSDRESGSPTSESSGNKEPSVDDDWEHDFDVELTEDDLKAAEEIAKKMGTNLDNQDDDWENWE